MTTDRVTTLRCEYAENPLGIDEMRPRLWWRLETEGADGRRGAAQAAYRVCVARSPELLADGENPDLWDSGRVDGGAEVSVAYDGAPLGTGERAYWTVTVWNEQGEAIHADGAPAWWEAAMLTPEVWRAAEWIGAPWSGGAQTASPCPYLRRSFEAPSGVLRSARLYVTALGLYEFRLNGARVGQDELAPGWTDYTKRLRHQTYDVKELIRPGEENVAGAILGDGWYSGHVGWLARQNYGDRPRLLARLFLQYENNPQGQEWTLNTDGAWTVSPGPILEADLLMGETYDARREMLGWDAPHYVPAHGTRWEPVETFGQPTQNIIAPTGPPVRATQELHPVGPPTVIAKWPEPDYIFDLGQNMVGRVRLKVRGAAGTTIRLRFGEVVNPNGTLYTANLRSARQTDYYTCKGDPDGEVFEPRFTFHGFRYVEILGATAPPVADDLVGVVLHSDTPKTGEWDCSDPLINQFMRNVDWGQRGNFVDVPTDCPQRDERLGWTGDAQVFIRTATCNRDVAGFFNKWIDDLYDAQSAEGALPPVAPNTGANIGPDGGPAWSDAGVICPWVLFQRYGDARLLARHYDNMARFIGYLERSSRDYIRHYDGHTSFGGFGDWLSINAETPRDLIGTAFFAHVTGLMARVAETLGKTEDADRYRALRAHVVAAFNNRFVTPAGVVAGGTQTAYVLALYFDLLPDAVRPAAAHELARDIERRGYKLSTGFVGSPYLNHVLTSVGRVDIAYRLLFQKDWPSWLYAVTQGATTIWERWDGWTHDKGFQDVSMNSFNHYAYGAVADWLYASVAGINIDETDDAHPAYQRLILRPHPYATGGAAGSVEPPTLDYARAALQSVNGKIESHWRKGDMATGEPLLTWDVTIPPNATATVYVPLATPTAKVLEAGVNADGTAGLRFVSRDDHSAIYEAVSGRYRFTTLT